PAGRHLTLFYLVMSVGGALGGFFNSILAPLVFDSLAEGGVTTLLAATLVLSPAMRPTPSLARLAAGLGIVAALPLALAATVFGVTDLLILKLAMFAPAALAAIALRRHLPAAAIAMGIVTVTGVWLIPNGDLFRDRSFFGTHRFMEEGGLRLYANGTTIHGAERARGLGR